MRFGGKSAQNLKMTENFQVQSGKYGDSNLASEKTDGRWCSIRGGVCLKASCQQHCDYEFHAG